MLPTLKEGSITVLSAVRYTIVTWTRQWT